MLSLVVRALLFIGASIASLVVARDATNFTFIQMTAVVVLWGLVVLILALWPRRRATRSDGLPNEAPNGSPQSSSSPSSTDQPSRASLTRK
jgi:hypothetical protein